jgi:hypothetical protein
MIDAVRDYCPPTKPIYRQAGPIKRSTRRDSTADRYQVTLVFLANFVRAAKRNDAIVPG